MLDLYVCVWKGINVVLFVLYHGRLLCYVMYVVLFSCYILWHGWLLCYIYIACMSCFIYMYLLLCTAACLVRTYFVPQRHATTTQLVLASIWFNKSNILYYIIYIYYNNALIIIPYIMLIYIYILVIITKFKK